MSEQTKTSTEDMIVVNGLPLPTRRQRKRMVLGMMLFCAGIVTYVTIWGDPSNSLHTSALAWAFGAAVATLFAYVFGAVADNFNLIKNVLKG